MATTDRPMRADARRNRDAVLDASADVLASNPDATMQELADASGLGRATVYRHFPAREDLVAALVERVVVEVTTAVSDTLRRCVTPEETLRRIAEDGVALGGRWRFLSQVTDRDPSEAGDDVLQEAGEEYVRWVVETQARGRLVPGDPAWISAATRAIIDAAVRSIEDPATAARAAGDTLVRAFLLPDAA